MPTKGRMSRRDFLALSTAVGISSWVPAALVPAIFDHSTFPAVDEEVSSGYMRLSSHLGSPYHGMVVQWGSADSNGAIVFPLEFTGVPSLFAQRSNFGPEPVQGVHLGGARSAPGVPWMALGMVD